MAAIWPYAGLIVTVTSIAGAKLVLRGIGKRR
jgi:hypothetical protein